MSANAYALLPKTTQATSVKVFDLNQDLSAHDEGACEAYYADLVIQGLVNRDNPAKIYFTNSPSEFNWYSRNRPPADQEFLEDGLIPVPRCKPVLNSKTAYPVLCYLLKHYANYIHGMVMIPNCGSPTNYDGVLAAGFTAGGILDAIPVTEGMSNYIASLRLHFPVLADTRGLSSNEAAFAWAYSNYFTANTCRSVIAYFTPHAYHAAYNQEFPDMLDYWIANRVFIFCLNPFVPTQYKLLHTILSPTNYPYGTPIQSIQYEEDDGPLDEQLGYCDDIVMAPNISVTCSFPSSPTTITAPTPTVLTTIDPNGVYVGFYLSDGDSFNVALREHYHNITRVNANNTVPVGWSLNPEFYDLFPTLLEYLSSYNANPDDIAAGENTNNLEFIADGFHNSMAVNNGYAPFIARYRYYLTNTHGMFRTLNMTPDVEFGGTGATLAEGEGLAIGAGFSGFISDYQGGLVVVPWITLDAGNVVCTRLSVPHLRRDQETPQSIVNDINDNINTSPAGQPVFAILCIGAEGRSVASLAPAIAELNANPKGRHFYYLKPSDVESAWLKWNNSLSNVLTNPNWSPTTVNGADGGRGWTYTSGASQRNDIYNTGYFPQTEGLYGFLRAQVLDGHRADDFEYAMSDWHPAIAGSQWRASAYFKPEDLHNRQVGQVVIEFGNAGNDVIGSATNVVVNRNSQDEWYLGVIPLTAPPGTAFVRMKAGIYDPVGDGVSGHVLVDNAILAPVPNAVEITATNAARPVDGSSH